MILLCVEWKLFCLIFWCAQEGGRKFCWWTVSTDFRMNTPGGCTKSWSVCRGSPHGEIGWRSLCFLLCLFIYLFIICLFIVCLCVCFLIIFKGLVVGSCINYLVQPIYIKVKPWFLCINQCIDLVCKPVYWFPLRDNYWTIIRYSIRVF